MGSEGFMYGLIVNLQSLQHSKVNPGINKGKRLSPLLLSKSLWSGSEDTKSIAEDFVSCRCLGINLIMESYESVQIFVATYQLGLVQV